MAFFSFGSKKGKVQKMLENGQFEDLLQEGVKDRKVREALFELLSSENPGVVGDALLTITNLVESNPKVIKDHLSEGVFRKISGLTRSKNPYVRENAMTLSYAIIKTYPELLRKYRSWIIDELKEQLETGDKNQKGFALIMIGELGLSELSNEVRALLNVEDKVILPFEGKKWVKLGEVARETLEKL